MNKIEKIEIRGAREHNLKEINLDIPKNQLVVISGISGSGKSSLAFDTIYAEGQRRYIESLSSYARQFLGQKGKPDFDSIEGLSPAISIDQKSTSHNPRSTVGTVTEVYDYLRLLFAKIGQPYCITCHHPITKSTIDEIVDSVLEKNSDNQLIKIISPVVQGRKGEHKELFKELFLEGFTNINLNSKPIELTNNHPQINPNKKNTVEVEIDSFRLSVDSISRLSQAIELAAEKANQSVVIEGKTRQSFNLGLMCANCGHSMSELEPRSFSFNSPFGACSECDGLGSIKKVDPSLVIPDYDKTISEGGVLPWNYSSKNWYGFVLRSVCEYYRFDMNRPLKNWRQDHLGILLNGEEGGTVKIPATYYSNNVRRTFSLNFGGVIGILTRRWRETESEAVRRDVEKYMTELPCSACDGQRLKPESLLVKINNLNINDIVSKPIINSVELIDKLEISERQKIVADRIFKEINSRLKFLDSVGLGYLTLDRKANTLAGGEAQRIRLASQIGSRLTGVLYILDEPSIGLHARDNSRLIEVLKELRDLNNSVIVVEHDQETIEAADYLVDIGPGAGKHGGRVMAAGTPLEVAENPQSITGRFLAGLDSIALPAKRRKAKQYVSVYGAYENNLKRANIHIPVNTLTCVTGVSGSGKSTITNEVLYKALARKLNRSLVKPGKYERLEGEDNLERVTLISQNPIGRTPRSNPATYTGVFTPIRELFAATKEAKIRGYKPGRFSFNVSGGRCENCQGDGVLRVEMQFMPDVYLPCDICEGKRYNRETLEAKFAGKSIADVLKMTVEEALMFFKDIPKIANKVELLFEVGLGYIELGQSATTLSGGEAQRIKLASELSRRKNNTLYILDEPTTGLHSADIKQLLEVLNRLVDQGNAVVVIEHNLDVIKTADWVIDLGPEGGDGGGKIIATGTPEEIAENTKSYTGKYLKKLLKK
ncbi:excinuclease ABC subunit UvrA [Candidatus Berkelbacteria bacterium]|nr:excinuclease ABC subunit UvrA [Candidatus Berkelbacteria bacterium]